MNCARLFPPRNEIHQRLLMQASFFMSLSISCLPELLLSCVLFENVEALYTTVWSGSTPGGTLEPLQPQERFSEHVDTRPLVPPSSEYVSPTSEHMELTPGIPFIYGFLHGEYSNMELIPPRPLPFPPGKSGAVPPGGPGPHLSWPGPASLALRWGGEGLREADRQRHHAFLLSGLVAVFPNGARTGEVRDAK